MRGVTDVRQRAPPGARVNRLVVVTHIGNAQSRLYGEDVGARSHRNSAAWSFVLSAARRMAAARRDCACHDPAAHVTWCATVSETQHHRLRQDNPWRGHRRTPSSDAPGGAAATPDSSALPVDATALVAGSMIGSAIFIVGRHRRSARRLLLRLGGHGDGRRPRRLSNES